MKTLKSKSKKWLAIAVAMCLGIALVMPLLAEVPRCPRPGETAKFAFRQDCNWFFYCDGTREWPTLRQCPVDENTHRPLLFFCPEKEICSWLWDPECTFDCYVNS